MKGSEFIPLYVGDPPLTDESDVYVTTIAALNHSGRCGTLQVFDSTRRDTTLNLLHLGAWGDGSSLVIIPCKVRDLAYEADFDGHVFVQVNDRERGRPYRVFPCRQ